MALTPERQKFFADLAAIVAEERERCAKLVDDLGAALDDAGWNNKAILDTVAATAKMIRNGTV